MRKGMGAVVLAAALSLSLVAASSSTPARGTAETRLFAVELDVDPGSAGSLGLLPGSVDVLDAGTYASTDTDAARNALGDGAPYAEAAVVPVRVGTTEFGAVRASSGSATETSTSSGGGIGSLTGVIGAQVAPVVATASAAEDEASAVLGDLSAQVAALAAVLDLDINAEDVASLVDTTRSASGVHVDVSALSLTLGDLIPADVLQQLPLSTILDLLEALPIDLDADVAGAIDDLQAAIGAVQDQLVAIEAAEAALADAAAPIIARLAAIDAVLVELARIESELLALDLTATDPAVIEGLVATVQGLLDDLHVAIDDAAALGVSADSCDALATTVDATTLLATVTAALTCITDLEAALATAIDQTLTAAAADGTGLLDEVTTLADAVAELETLLGTVTAAAQALLTFVQDLLDGVTDAAAVELVGIDGFDVGLSAVSTGDTSTSQAVVGCTAVTARVLGQSTQTPACADGLAQVTAVADQVEGAIARIEAVLGLLPVSDVAAIDDLRLELFGALVESVVEDGDYVVSTAAIELLELEVPSLTIDPAGITSWLGSLELGDVLGVVRTELDQAQATLQQVFGETWPPVADGLFATLDGAFALIEGETAVLSQAVEAARQALADLLAALPEPLAVEFATPGLTLMIDPVATAEFAPGSTTGAPDPTDGGDPLPSTGGGLALMGLIGIGGALALRKRR